MACGCFQSRPHPETTTRPMHREKAVRLAPGQVRPAWPSRVGTSADAGWDRAVVCDSCAKAQRDTGRVVACSVLGRRIGDVLGDANAACPRGKWGQFDGHKPTIRWCGVSWIGAPEPLRWRVLLRLGRNPRLTSCGCIVVLARGRFRAYLEPIFAISPLLRRWVADEVLPSIREARRAIRDAFPASTSPRPAIGRGCTTRRASPGGTGPTVRCGCGTAPQPQQAM
jgi:hypothetical protein